MSDKIITEDSILCEAQYTTGYPAKVMYYQYADQKKDKNGNVPREKMKITKGRLYMVAKKVVEGWERNHKKALNKGSKDAEVYCNYKKLLWKRVK